jgi:hypothetical protein
LGHSDHGGERLVSKPNLTFGHRHRNSGRRSQPFRFGESVSWHRKSNLKLIISPQKNEGIPEAAVAMCGCRTANQNTKRKTDARRQI